MDSTPSTPTSNHGSKKRHNSAKRPKKLAPIEGLTLLLHYCGQNNPSFDTDAPQVLTSKSNSGLNKTKCIQRKKDLVDAVRRVAPATVQISPVLFHDISSNLKTV
jgi:hypothetical protein